VSYEDLASGSMFGHRGSTPPEAGGFRVGERAWWRDSGRLAGRIYKILPYGHPHAIGPRKARAAYVERHGEMIPIALALLTSYGPGMHHPEPLQNPAEQRVICAWCKKVLEEGDPGAPVSHGMCQECRDRLRPRSNPDEGLRRLERGAATGDPAVVGRLIRARLQRGTPHALHSACVTLHRIVRSIVTPLGGRVGYENRVDVCFRPHLFEGSRFWVSVHSTRGSHIMSVDFNLQAWSARISRRVGILYRPMSRAIRDFARGMGMKVSYGLIRPGTPTRDLGEYPDPEDRER
jgi:hypothetical protein